MGREYYILSPHSLPLYIFDCMFSCMSSEFSLGETSSILCVLSQRLCFTSVVSPELSPTGARSFHKCNVQKSDYFTSSVLHFGLCIPVQCFLRSFQIDAIDSCSVCDKTCRYFAEDCCVVLCKCSWFCYS